MQNGSALDASTFDFTSTTLSGVLTIKNSIQNDFDKIQKYSLVLSSNFNDITYSNASLQAFDFEIYCDNVNPFILSDAPLT